MVKELKPITDADISRALSLFNDYPSGLSRADLERYFRSDRRARQIIETLVATGRAAVISTEDALGNQVYRLAQTREEVEHEARKLTSYQKSLERRRSGLLKAWERGGTFEQQKGIF